MRKLAALFILSSCASTTTPRVVLVAIDGTRWQEVFRGADPALPGATPDLLGGTPQDRRRALMPFLWETVATQGQIFGNPDRGSRVAVANPWKGSYPGYHEMLCGFVSPIIVGNARIPNPDATVLEWLERRPGFGGAVGAYASWDVFASILNQRRNGVRVDVGKPPPDPDLLERLQTEVPTPWNDAVYDGFVFRRALQYLAEKQPRALFIGLGDTDEWAHGRRYDRYLQAIHRADGWLRELWEKLQALPAYRGQTSLVVTADHGRGGAETWHSHGSDVPGSEAVWVAVLGPTTPPLGERQSHAPLTLAQVASTVAAFAGQGPAFAAASPRAAPPLPLSGP